MVKWRDNPREKDGVGGGGGHTTISNTEDAKMEAQMIKCR